MGISIIPNQPILFRSTDEIEVGCECNEQPFCQIINPIDQTQFQILASDEVVNGNFEDDLNGWVNSEYIEIELELFNPVDDEEPCSGTVQATATGGTAPYNYKLNGIGAGNSFGYFAALCAGNYFILVTDANGNQASIEFTLVVNVVCGDYTLTTDFVNVETIELRNCRTTDFI